MTATQTYFRLFIQLTDVEATPVQSLCQQLFDTVEAQLTTYGHRFRHRSAMFELVVETQDGGAVWDFDLEARLSETDFLKQLSLITAALTQAGMHFIGSYVLMDADDGEIGEEIDL